MKRLLPRLMLVAAFAASATLAEAQAVARGGGGGSSSSSSGSSGSSSGGGGGGGGSTSSTSSSSSGGSTYSAPAPVHSAPPRTPSHSGSSGSSGSSASSGGGGSHGNYNGTASVRRPDGGSSTNATAPTYARPDGSAYAGRYAVPRQRTPGTGRPPIYIYSPYYVVNPWGFGPFGYGYGLSYFYDPFYSGGLGWPGYGGYGYGGYGSGGVYGYPSSGYGYYDGGGSGYNTWESGSSEEKPEQDGPTGELRLKVKPREAKVIVDGAFMGTVDDFDGLFQKLSIADGRHQITLQLDGYQTLTFDVVIIAGQTVNYKGEMQKLGNVKH
jgi:hypothetical protein